MRRTNSLIEREAKLEIALHNHFRGLGTYNRFQNMKQTHFIILQANASSHEEQLELCTTLASKMNAFFREEKRK